MTAFTADAAAALPGPSWLKRRRTEAFARFEAAGLPSTDEEVWRYSRIDELELDAYVPGTGGGDQPIPDRAVRVVSLVEPAAEAITLDGGMCAFNTHDEHVELGTATIEGAERLLGAITGDATDPFTALNDAFAADPVVLRVPPGTAISRPVIAVHHGTADGEASFPRLVIDAGDGSELTVLEVNLSGDGAGLVVPVTEINVGRGANVRYISVQQLGFATWQIGLQASRVAQEGTLRSVAVGFGGDYARMRTNCELAGRGAHGELDAVYFGEANQMLDFRTFQDHAAPDTTSNLLFKGAVGGHSRSVYTGLIHVAKEARGTNAFQTNRNIKLSEHAWAESVPNLVIENNDVRCSHASTVGPVDEDERFYLESRGIPTDVAERLIVTGFFDEVLQHVGVPDVLPWLRATIAEKFERREA
jgi:Fe-S cluster assembly protein SufD